MTGVLDGGGHEVVFEEVFVLSGSVDLDATKAFVV